MTELTRFRVLPFSMPCPRRLWTALPVGLLSLSLALVGCAGDETASENGAPAEDAPAEEVVVLTGDEAAAAVEAGEAEAYPLDVCMVAGEPLGSMGPPASLVYDGQQIKFCCAGCDDVFLADPDSYLTRLETDEASDEPADEPDHDRDHDHDHS